MAEAASPPPAARPLGGAAAILGGLLWATEGVLGESFPQALIFLAPLLLAGGITGFFLLYRAPLKGLGQSGFTQGVVGLGMLAGGFFGAYTLGEEPLVRVASFGFLLTAFGLVLLGYGCIRENVLGRFYWLPLALGAVAPLGLLFGSAGPARVALSLLFGLGWVLLGALMLAGLAERGEKGRA
ncbi:Hypothetical Protein RradSPS_2305 [Rubrobacter radiotolerans]|uniref:DUF308 domain-containing protein n=1 Tax=Rubrobacter radiotolerans TaxID=42256 RepID=A0A023X5K5_RUBRA|nr:hypothetical protein [Rubrobacter radiotolerans]AHY47588.1 Hypothetical Protein RradSPS_2305 [Rubrobacter radiotolerans]MDX5894993.1 hypothetical protein [Rubrobacter radiotolerans]SMC07233.1 hypothetical protein SAMN00767673_2308 [Rubrobacter radiotolerans DSM 5868]